MSRVKVESSAFAFVCLEISNLLKLEISTLLKLENSCLLLFSEGLKFQATEGLKSNAKADDSNLNDSKPVVKSYFFTVYLKFERIFASWQKIIKIFILSNPLFLLLIGRYVRSNPLEHVGYLSLHLWPGSDQGLRFRIHF